MERLSDTFGGQGLTVIALSTDAIDTVDAYFEGVDRPDIVVGWVDRDARAKAHVHVAPTLFLLDERHRVVWHSSEYKIPFDQLVGEVQILLGE